MFNFIKDLFRGKKRTEEQPFPAPGYGAGYTIGYYFNRPLAEIGGWSLAIRHGFAVGFFLIALIVWHAGFTPFLGNFLSDKGVFNWTVIFWFLAASGLLSALLATAENKQRALVWLGFRPSETRKANVKAPDAPRMRLITRAVSYATIGVELATLFWWLSVVLVFLIFPETSSQFSLFVPALFFMSVLGITTALHLDRIWFFRRTKLPGIVAFLGAMAIFLLFYQGVGEEFGWFRLTPLGEP